MCIHMDRVSLLVLYLRMYRNRVMMYNRDLYHRFHRRDLIDDLNRLSAYRYRRYHSKMRKLRSVLVRYLN